MEEKIIYNFQENEYQKIGLQIGSNLLKNRKQILQKRQALEEPHSLEEYCSALPLELYNLLDGIIRILFEKKRHRKLKNYNNDNNYQKLIIKKFKKSQFLFVQ